VQPAKYDLIVDLRVARKLGIAIALDAGQGRPGA
jgi:hypothetical protein